MPLVYRTYSFDSTSSTSESSPSTPVDLDDTIVLSDLVRTGEASRLRRRGAIRMDHNGTGLGSTQRHQESTEMLDWGYGDPDAEDEIDGGYDWPERELFGEDGGVTLGMEYTLYCGTEEEASDSVSDSEDGPYELSPLPCYPPHPAQTVRHRPRRTRRTGCGAVIHSNASPRLSCSVWAARSPASEVVVPLDKEYFDEGTARQLVQSSCGCLREGVGCAQCGNILGTRYKPCQVATNGIFAPPLTSSSAPILRSRTHHTPTYIYSFFSSSVSSHPEFQFAPPIAVHIQRHSERYPDYDSEYQTPTVIAPDAPDDDGPWSAYMRSPSPYSYSYFVDRPLANSPLPITTTLDNEHADQPEPLGPAEDRRADDASPGAEQHTPLVPSPSEQDKTPLDR